MSTKHNADSKYMLTADRLFLDNNLRSSIGLPASLIKVCTNYSTTNSIWTYSATECWCENTL